MRRTSLLFLAALFALLPGVAKAQVQIFGGYSYVRPTVNVQTTVPCPGPTCPVTTTSTHFNLNGWEAAGSFNPIPVFGFTADFAGNYGTVQGSTLHMQTYLFGPQVHLPGSVSPFVHALGGIAHETIAGSSNSVPVVLPYSANSFAAAVGGGIDIKVVPFVSLRVIQIDDVITRFGSATQHQPRASAGIVIHF